MLGQNLIRNPDCILSEGEWDSGSLGPDDWISFNGDLNIATQQDVIAEAGDYLLVVVYEASASIQAKVGDDAFQSLLENAGGVVELTFTVGEPGPDTLVFRDPDETATGRILHVELRQIN